MKVVFFSVLSSTPAFLARPVYHINNSPKIIVNFTKFATEKHTSLQLALNLHYKRKSLLKGIFLHCGEKDQTNNFSAFFTQRTFVHLKEFLKNSQSHFKGFHFKSTSSGSFNKVYQKSRNHTEIRNPSEAYLESSERSMTEPFCFNS